MPEEPFVAQIDLRSFYVYSPKPTFGRVVCRGLVKDEVQALQGLQTVTLRSDCKLDSAGFILEPVVEFGERAEGYQAINIRFPNVSTKKLDWAEDVGHLDGSADNNSPTIAEIASRWDEKDLHEEQHWSLLKWISVIIGAVGMVLLALWIIKCIWDVKKRGDYRQTLSSITKDVQALYTRMARRRPVAEPPVAFRAVNRLGDDEEREMSTFGEDRGSEPEDGGE